MILRQQWRGVVGQPGMPSTTGQSVAGQPIKKKKNDLLEERRWFCGDER